MSVLVDGRNIAEVLKKELVQEFRGFKERPSLGVIVATEALTTRKFVERKRKFGKEIGIEVKMYDLPSNATTKALTDAIQHAVRLNEGVVVQLPLSPDADVDTVRNAIPASHDIDVISDEAIAVFETGASDVLPPVVGAIAMIAKQHDISFFGKHVVVVGSGRLVGKPAAVWAQQQGAEVKILNDQSHDILHETKQADIVVLGAGSPGFLKPEMVKEGVVIFDAGTSEAAGKLAGDADPACAARASLMTPVPGGIGPITVAMIFKNLLTFAKCS